MNGRFKYCISRVGGRGAGLGNELIPWARAFVAASVLGAQTLGPAFGLNHRKYWRHFGTPRYDWFAQRALEYALPRFEFTESDFVNYGGDCLSDAIRRFAEHHRLRERSAWVLLTRGMWGGYRHIIEARAFVRSTLTLSRFAAANLATIRSRLDCNRITVAMHVRLGDFSPSRSEPSQDAYRGRFNVSLPLEWYINIASTLRGTLGDNVQFLIVSDGSMQQLAPLLDSCGGITTTDIPDSDVSDLLALADADLLVCSISSYSLWAAFLSDAPYLWFEPHLQKLDGYYSIWGHHPGQLESGSYTRRAVEKFASGAAGLVPGRGIVVPYEGALPETLFATLAARHQRPRLESDLVYCGVLPTTQP